MEKINLVIIEKDDAMFDRLRQDIKGYSPYVNKIYRSSYHSDIYKIDEWYKCKLVIADNPEDAGLDFFKSFYLNPIVTDNKIFGIIYTRSHENEIQFYRITRFLYERSQNLFLGVIYKRYGSLEKILEVIRNIANNWFCYPMIDWMQREEKPAVVNPKRLELLRKLHNLRYQILNKLQPLIINLTEFSENKDTNKLKKNIKGNRSYFENIQTNYQKLKELLREFLQFKIKDQRLSFDNIRNETSFYVKQLKNFINLDEANVPNNLTYGGI